MKPLTRISQVGCPTFCNKTISASVKSVPSSSRPGHHISRSRQMHDGTGTASDHSAPTETSGQQFQANSSSSQWQSSYQAQSSGQQAGVPTKRSGKKSFTTADPSSHTFGGTSSSFFQGGATQQRSDTISVPADLMHGTTRATKIVPG